MTFSQSDLTPLLQAPPGAQVRYASGILRAFDPETFENVVEVRGTNWVNLPLLAATDAITWRLGDVVGLIGSDPAGRSGVTSYAILGRFVVPGVGTAEQVVEWMTTELGRSIAASVFADRIAEPGLVGDVETGAPAGSFGDLPTVGPSTTATVTETGRMIVFMASLVTVPAGAAGTRVGRMSVDLTGPTPVAADAGRSLQLSQFDASDHSVSMRACNVEVYEGLTAGDYEITAKYQASTGVFFGTRRVIVIAF